LCDRVKKPPLMEIAQTGHLKPRKALRPKQGAYTPLNNMKIIPILPLVAVLALAGCDKAEQERKDAIKDRAEAIDKEADATRAKAKSDAHATQAAGEQTAKDMEQKADAVRQQK